MDVFLEELQRSNDILKRNRHNSANGEWYGPSPEPRPASKDCTCAGCWARFYKPSRYVPVGGVERAQAPGSPGD